MTTAAILLTPILLAVVAYLAGRTRRGLDELDERRRLEAIDERVAAANSRPNAHIEVAPQRPPTP